MATAVKKVAVVTGATSGIGRALARERARAGWRVIGIGRAEKRSLHVSQAIRAQTGNPSVTFLTADLTSLAEVKKLAAEILKLQPKLDLLVNNAGSLFQKRSETAEGFERTLALNHLAPFTLTNKLLPALQPGARIINVSSDLHRQAHLRLDDLGMAARYRGMRQYCHTKLMNVLFTRALVSRVPAGIMPLALHPGLVATRFGNENGLLWRAAMRVMQLLGISPEQAARGIMKAIEDREAEPGGYYHRGRRRQPSAPGQSDELAEGLWQETEALLKPDRK